jgi:chorismate mutase
VPAFTQRAGDALRGAVRMTPGRAAQTLDRAGGKSAGGGRRAPFGAPSNDAELIDLQHRRDQLNARVAELQWDLGGLVYEMAIRDRIRIDVLVRRSAELQKVDAELGEVERILRLEQTSTAGECASCAAPHSVGAVFCWQCGQPLLKQVQSDAIGA